MGWLIDTSLWIAVERGAIGAADIHAVTKQEPVYLSPINIAEMRFGLELLPAGPPPPLESWRPESGRADATPASG